MVLEDLKESIRNKKIFFTVGIALFIMLTVYASGFLQIAYLLYFKPEKIIPFPISITYYLLFIAIPLLIILLGHDSVSSQIENHHIRGIISKISRSSFILAKFFSLLIIISCLSFLVLLSSSIFTLIKFRQLDLLNPLIFLFYLFFYIAALSAVSIFFSSVSSKSSTSLLTLMLFFLFLLYINLKPLKVISLFHYMHFSDILMPISVFIIYSLIFMSSSLLIFQARDL